MVAMFKGNNNILSLVAFVVSFYDKQVKKYHFA